MIEPSDEDVYRQLDFTVSREMGSRGIVRVAITVVYTPEPQAQYFTPNITRTFVEGQGSVTVTLQSTTDAYLEAYRTINITVTSVTLLSSDGMCCTLYEVSNYIPTISCLG